MSIRRKLLVISLLFSSLAVRAGHESGNGGGGWLCPGADSVELLDLWEGEKLFELKIRRNANRWDEQLTEVLDNLHLQAGKTFAASVRVATERLKEQIEKHPKTFLPDGVGIAPPADARHEYIKKGCSLVGLALYSDRYQWLDLDRDYFPKLAPTDHAALLFHEGSYKVLREWFDVKDSILARQITACAFARKPCPQLNPWDGVPEKGRYVCTVRKWTGSDRGPSQVVFYSGGKCGDQVRGTPWRVQVTAVNLKPTPAKSYLDICPSIDIEPFLDGKGHKFGHQDWGRLRASDERFQNITYPIDAHVSFTEKGLSVNNREFTCRKE